MGITIHVSEIVALCIDGLDVEIVDAITVVVARKRFCAVFGIHRVQKPGGLVVSQVR